MGPFLLPVGGSLLRMPSDRKKKKAAAAKGKAKAKVAGTKTGDEAAPQASASSSPQTDGVQNGEASSLVTSNRACTGVLASTPMSRDLHISSLTLLFHGHELLTDSTLELNYGR